MRKRAVLVVVVVVVELGSGLHQLREGEEEAGGCEKGRVCRKLEVKSPYEISIE